jgi:Tol biopolymer transport system component
MRARRTVICAAAAAAVVALTPTPSSAEPRPTVGPGRIVFGGETADQGTQLFSVWPNGTHLRQLTHVDGSATQPDWSPDGRSIVFEWDLPDDAGVVTAFIDADGSNLRTLDPTVCIDAQPAYAPDGQRIVFESYNCDVDDALFSRNVDGSDPQRITPVGPNGFTDPNLSPDGTKLSYVEYENGIEYRQALVVSNADGSDPHQLTPYSFDVGIKQAWSPDGGQLVFTKDANPIDGGPLEANVAVINADGSGLHVLTDYQGGHLSAFAGSFSPDGRWIVYRLQDNDGGTSALWKMRTDGTHRRQIFEQDGLRARGIDWGAPS